MENLNGTVLLLFVVRATLLTSTKPLIEFWSQSRFLHVRAENTSPATTTKLEITENYSTEWVIPSQLETKCDLTRTASREWDVPAKTQRAASSHLPFPNDLLTHLTLAAAVHCSAGICSPRTRESVRWGNPQRFWAISKECSRTESATPMDLPLVNFSKRTSRVKGTTNGDLATFIGSRSTCLLPLLPPPLQNFERLWVFSLSDISLWSMCSTSGSKATRRGNGFEYVAVISTHDVLPGAMIPILPSFYVVIRKIFSNFYLWTKIFYFYEIKKCQLNHLHLVLKVGKDVILPQWKQPG